MRNIIPAIALTAIAVASLATPALAEIDGVNPNYSNYYAPGAVAAGAVVGTAVAVGGVAGIGTVALLEGVTAKCHGFGVIWTARSECVNGQWVGDGPVRRVVR